MSLQRTPHQIASSALILLAVTFPFEAEATYSILAYDRGTGTFGGAVASCVPLETVELVYGATHADAATRGAVMTQSYLLEGAKEDAVAALASGMPAVDVLEGLLDPAYDPSFSLRQYAVVDASFQVAAFTGSQALSVASDRTFESGDFIGSVQGNILTDPQLLTLAADAFEQAEHCRLGERLLRALEAAGQSPHGDARCVDHGKPALSATLGLDPAQGPPLRLRAETSEHDADNPVELLRASFDAAGPDLCEPPEPPPEGGGDAGGGPTDDETAEDQPESCAVGRVGGAAPRNPAWVLSALLATWLARRRRGSWRRSRQRGACSLRRAHR